jgi:hypothetical protein
MRKILIFTHILLILTLILISFFGFVVKETKAWLAYNPNNVTLLKYRGLGYSNEVGILGYLPVEFIIPLTQEFRIPYDPNEIRRIKIKKLLGKGKALCSFVDYYSDNSIRATGKGILHFTVSLPSCAMIRYDELICYDNKKKILSEICNGTGKLILVNKSNTVIYEAEYENYSLKNIKFWNDKNELIHDGPPPLRIKKL